MKINGSRLALHIYQNLKNRTKKLKKQGVTPHIAVVLIGDDPASRSYVSQKEKWSAHIGILFSLVHYPLDVSQKEIIQSIKHLNNDSSVHGIIVQRPLPAHIDKDKLTDTITLTKDIDGFRPDSIFTVPVAQAVEKVLKDLRHLSGGDQNLIKWLHSQSIVIVGKGETAGEPIIKHLQKMGLRPIVISSTTPNPEVIIKKADIVISAVGKSEVIKPEFVKRDAIVLGVGMFKGEDEKLHGDYISKKIKEKASYYTPVTGGIGPVNVAYLLSNLVTSAETSAIDKN